MTDGDGESGRDGESVSSKNTISSEDEFSRAISTIAVGQLCEKSEFQGIQRAAIDVLSDIAIRYISDLGKSSKFYAGISGRTDCNVFDILQGLEDLGSSCGFTGASNIDHCLANSGVFHEITQYMSTLEELPFAQSIPCYPIHRPGKHTPSFQQISEMPPGKHIPNWLPAFPDPHTYIQTPIWNKKARDPKGDKIKQVEQRRKAELSLLNLQQRLVNVNSEANQGSRDKQVSLVSVVNPFLAKALQSGEREVSQLVYPGETAARETKSVNPHLAPVIEEALNSSRAQEPGNSGSNGLPRKRMTVKFKVGTDKKTLTTNFLLGTRGSAESTATTWLLRDDDRRDDKKRRANVILKESMENPHELHQL